MTRRGARRSTRAVCCAAALALATACASPPRTGKCRASACFAAAAEVAEAERDDERPSSGGGISGIALVLGAGMILTAAATVAFVVAVAKARD